jgi:hypothetical protein
MKIRLTALFLFALLGFPLIAGTPVYALEGNGEGMW